MNDFSILKQTHAKMVIVRETSSRVYEILKSFKEKLLTVSITGIDQRSNHQSCNLLFCKQKNVLNIRVFKTCFLFKIVKLFLAGCNNSYSSLFLVNTKYLQPVLKEFSFYLGTMCAGILFFGCDRSKVGYFII